MAKPRMVKVFAGLGPDVKQADELEELFHARFTIQTRALPDEHSRPPRTRRREPCVRRKPVRSARKSFGRPTRRF